MRGISDVCGCFPTGRQYPGISHLTHSVFTGVAQELDPSQPWENHPIAMIDTETTGTEAAEDRIIEIAIVKGCNGVVLSRDAWLVNPGRHIPEASSAVHGIRDEDVRMKPSFADVCSEVLACMDGCIPGAYNAPFDRGFLLAETRRVGRADLADVPAIRDRVVWLDPLVWARFLYPNEKSRKLTAMASLFGIALEQAHRATADAEATLMLMYKMAEDSRIPKGYGKMVQEQVSAARAQDDARRMWRGR